MKRSLEQEVAVLRRQLDEVSHQLANLASRSVDELGETVGDYAEEVGGAAREKWDAARQRAKHFGRQGREYVEDHPWQSMGMAVAVGFLAGFLLKHRD